MGSNHTGLSVEASIKVHLTWDVEEHCWFVDRIDEGWPLDYEVKPHLVDDDLGGTAAEADLDAARQSYVFVSDLHALLTEVLEMLDL